MSKFFGQPTIPESVMQDMTELSAPAQEYDSDNGGQYWPGVIERIPFRGAVLPLSATDIRFMSQGSYTVDTRKIYTNGYALRDGTQIEDAEGVRYTITADLNYGPISSFKRYLAERKGSAAPKGITS